MPDMIPEKEKVGKWYEYVTVGEVDVCQTFFKSIHLGARIEISTVDGDRYFYFTEEQAIEIIDTIQKAIDRKHRYEEERK